MGKKQAVAALEEERERRIEESKHLSEEEVKRRLQIVHKLVDVQKELLATHPPTKVQSLVLMTYIPLANIPPTPLLSPTGYPWYSVAGDAGGC